MALVPSMLGRPIVRSVVVSTATTALRTQASGGTACPVDGKPRGKRSGDTCRGIPIAHALASGDTQPRRRVFRLSRAHLYRTVQSLGGALVVGASVTICEAGTSTPILQILYTTETGSDTRSNPFLAADGIIDVYLHDSQDVDLIITYGSSTLTAAYQNVLPPSDEIFTAGSPVTVTNGPSTNYLLAGVDPTHAVWVPPSSVIPGQLDAAMPQPS